MRVALILPVIVLVASSCSPTGDRDPAATDVTPMAAETPTSVEPSGANRRAAPAPSLISTEQAASNSAMPEAIRGQWRKNDLGRDPTEEDCIQTSQSNDNFGKVLTVNAGGYSLFEDGGRILNVHSRTDNIIDATFDTTYADAPTRARQSFALQSNRTLAVNTDGGNGRANVTEYLRCP